MINCPSNKLNKKQRIEIIYDEFNKWISDGSMIDLIKLTGGTIPAFNSFTEKFQWMYDYSRKWDFRKLQGAGGERWLVKDQDIYKTNFKEIQFIAKKMGLEGEPQINKKPNYLLILGGARMSNYTRCELAKKIYEKYSDNIKSIIALSGLRKLDDIEMDYIKKYAPESRTEFDAISCALESIFGINHNLKNDITNNHSNLNLAWVKRKYVEHINNISFYSLAAPSSDGNRRANSFDTFEFFLDNFNVENNENILAITSSIYVPFQTVKFLQLALERNLNVEFTGGAAGHFNNASNYCQEIKATFDAMKNFMDLYPLYK